MAPMRGVDVRPGNEQVHAAHVVEHAPDRARGVARIGEVAAVVAERGIVGGQHDVAPLGQLPGVGPIRFALAVDDLLAQGAGRVQRENGGQLFAGRAIGRQIEPGPDPIPLVGCQRQRLARELFLAHFFAHPDVQRHQPIAAGQIAHGLLHAREDLPAPERPIGGRLDGPVLAVGSAIGQQLRMFRRRRISGAQARSGTSPA